MKKGDQHMTRGGRAGSLVGIALLVLMALAARPAAAQQQQPGSAANSITGQVTGAGAPIAGSTVTLFTASGPTPKQLAQAKTGADGRFAMQAVGAPAKDAILYLVAKGGRPA